MTSENKLDREIVASAIQAIRQPSEWEQLLEQIIKKTPAKAAIITLRDKDTCQIVNDDALEREYHSPLICGFPLEAVVYYITELRTIDPWAEFQRTHYPYRPTIMSKVCPPESSKDQRFFNWLRSGGLEDTIVFELDRMAGYWTACNLFLDTRNKESADDLLAFAEVHFEFLRETWRTSQELVKHRQAGRATFDQFARFGVAACIVGANGELREANARFDAMIESGEIEASGPEKRLSFSRDAEVEGISKWQKTSISRHSRSSSAYRVSATAIEPDPLFKGKRENLWLLTILEKPGTTNSGTFDRGALSGLTKQETGMLEAITAGMKVSDAGASIGVRRSRAFEIWASIKEKLGITNAHNIR